MSFDISKLTSAVNKYLNSISEIGSAAQKAQQEIADKTQFSVELSDAIQQNIESRMHDQMTIPDIGSQVRNTVETQIDQAVSAIDNTFEQVNGAFEEIRKAGAATDSIKETTVADASTENSKVAATSKQAAASSSASNTNRDAYSGILSTEALQDLSKSQYFSANLIQDSLFKEDSDSENKSSTSTSPFDTVSLSDLNTNSLLANALTNGKNVTGLTNALNSEAASSASAVANSSDLAKALIKAYTNSASTVSPTSIFGDFSL